MLGDYRVAKGIILNLDVPEYDLLGNYLIISVKHNIDNNKELIDFKMEKFSD